MDQWKPLLLTALISLAIPLAILLGSRRPNGSLIVTSSGAILAFAVFWFPLGGMSGFQAGQHHPVDLIVYNGGLLLLLASWVLALGMSVQARQWGWIALLVGAGYLSMLAYLAAEDPPDVCIFPYPIEGITDFCHPLNALEPVLIIAGHFFAPLAALAPVVARRLIPRRLGLPDGLRISPLATTSESETDPEMRVERL